MRNHILISNRVTATTGTDVATITSSITAAITAYHNIIMSSLWVVVLRYQGRVVCRIGALLRSGHLGPVEEPISVIAAIIITATTCVVSIVVIATM